MTCWSGGLECESRQKKRRQMKNRTQPRSHPIQRPLYLEPPIHPPNRITNASSLLSSTAMSSLVRNATSTISRRLSGFERLEEDHRRRTRRNGTRSPYSYRSRSDRAKKRQIFLRSYQLSYYVEKVKRSKTEKLKKMAVKVRAFVVSAVTLLRVGALRSCNGRSAISAASPAAPAVRISA